MGVLINSVREIIHISNNHIVYFVGKPFVSLNFSPENKNPCYKHWSRDFSILSYAYSVIFLSSNNYILCLAQTLFFLFCLILMGTKIYQMKESVGGGVLYPHYLHEIKKNNTNRQLLIRNNENQKTMECKF